MAVPLDNGPVPSLQKAVLRGVILRVFFMVLLMVLLRYFRFFFYNTFSARTSMWDFRATYKALPTASAMVSATPASEKCSVVCFF